MMRLLAVAHGFELFPKWKQLSNEASPQTGKA